MMFYSLNNTEEKSNFKEAIFNSLASDGGLYFPERINKLSLDFLNNISNYNNYEIGYEVMKNFVLSKSRRLRSTPFTSRIEKQGVKSYTIYNHMLLPTTFSSPEEEYVHLKEHVQIWDVSVQREIEISGKIKTKNFLGKDTFLSFSPLPETIIGFL